MKPDKQRIAIAEYCGWKRVDNDPDRHPYWMAPVGDYRHGSPLDVNLIKGEMVKKMFPYLEDLNAMHEAEKTIPKRDKGIYANNLMHVVGPDGETDMVDDYGEWSTSPTTSVFAMLHATAAQRAEAFLKTIGKWEE